MSDYELVRNGTDVVAAWMRDATTPGTRTYTALITLEAGDYVELFTNFDPTDLTVGPQNVKMVRVSSDFCEPPAENLVEIVSEVNSAGDDASQTDPQDIPSQFPGIQDGDILLALLVTTVATVTGPGAWAEHGPESQPGVGRISLYSYTYDSGTYTDPNWDWTGSSDFRLYLMHVAPQTGDTVSIQFEGFQDPDFETVGFYPAVTSPAAPGGLVIAAILGGTGTNPAGPPPGYTALTEPFNNAGFCSYLEGAPSPETPGSTTFGGATGGYLSASFYVAGEIA